MLQTGLAQLDAPQGEKSPVTAQSVSKKGCLVHWSVTKDNYKFSEPNQSLLLILLITEWVDDKIILIIVIMLIKERKTVD